MFTPVETSVGALLLHQATSILLYNNGAVLGLSGYMRRLLSKPTVGVVALFAGMAASFPLLRLIVPELLTQYPPAPSTARQALITVVMGLLVGWGTKAANGCTSGHMLCGLSRLNGRSVLAVAIFFPVALITHHLIHPTLLTTVCTADVPCYTPTYPPATTTTSLVLLAVATILAARTIPHFIAKLSQHTTNQEISKTSSCFNRPARIATEFFSGLLFALGLIMTQMAHPAKVSSFLSFPALHAWDPSMALVILFGVLPSLIENLSRGFDKPPRFSDKYGFSGKTLKEVDWKFLLGAVVFGVGWGASGTCPGPAVVRAFVQPAWGMLWVGGFWIGGLIS